MNTFELKTPSGIELFAQVMEPLATEPLVVLASASPIVGELLGENRMIFVSGHSQEPSLPHPRRVRLRRLALIRLPRRGSATLCVMAADVVDRKALEWRVRGAEGEWFERHTISHDLPQLATDVLVAGWDTQSLRVLAGEGPDARCRRSVRSR